MIEVVQITKVQPALEHGFIPPPAGTQKGARGGIPLDVYVATRTVHAQQVLRLAGQ